MVSPPHRVPRLGRSEGDQSQASSAQQTLEGGVGGRGRSYLYTDSGSIITKLRQKNAGFRELVGH